MRFESNGMGNINLRSETPPEDSIQLFSSEFGSYSVRALTENRLYTRARARTRRMKIVNVIFRKDLLDK